ncbi:copper chaperone PCu(A)C [Vannielia litorea]|uniref:Copper-binding protein n=1 Tax=Vannielia litorea TaxID=1217970 RepID=A0A1N6EEE7_9RHOB|nr:copper chaperone PCu(A)C [Vannielia litorea]SIN81376.1 hypothetical protein SAMN05444002_0668 [Vannielia litorea]
MKLNALTLAALLAATPALAEIKVMDAYARAASPTAKSGAAFMQIMNDGAEEDRLIDAASDAAARVELHTHKDLGDGVMKMMQVEEGFAVPAGGMHALARGGDHVMLMGLTGPLEQGATVSITLTFEKAGEMVVEVPIDNERQDHGAMDHSKMGN